MSEFNNPLFDDILEKLLIDWRSAYPGADTSSGSIIYGDASALASALWGLYKNQNWIRSNLVPDGPSSEILYRWASIYSISIAGKTDSEILTAFKSRLRNPSAGGNKVDIESWASSVESSGILNLPLELDVPATLTNDGLYSFYAENFTDGNELNTAFTTLGAIAGANFVLDYGEDEGEDLVGVGFWKYSLEDAVFKVECSDDGAIYTELLETFTISGLGWSFGTWTAPGSKRYYRFTLTAATTLEIKFGEIEFYSNSTERVASAVCYPGYLAIGTFHLVASVESTRITNKLLSEIFDYLDFKCPVAPSEIFVLRPVQNPITIDVTVYGDNVDIETIESLIRNYIDSLDSGDAFFVSQITLICLQNGAINVNVNNPTADIYPGAFERIVEDSISVSLSND